MAKSNKNFKMTLDFLLNVAADKSQIDKVAKYIDDAMEINPELNVDDKQVREGVQQALKGLEQLIGESDNLEKALESLEISIDSKEGKEAIKELEGFIDSLDKELDKVNLDKLEESLSDLDDDQLRKLADALDKTDQAISGQNWKSEVSKLSGEFKNARRELEGLIDEQNTALAAMRKAGNTGSDAYNKLEKEIQEATEELKKYDEALGGLDGVQGKASESFVDTAARFEVIQDVGNKLTDFAEKGTAARNALREVQAQTGSTAEELGELGKAAERAFGAGIGDNLGEAIKAIGYGKQVLGDFLDNAQIEEFTIGAGKIAKVFDKDINEVIAGSRTFIAQWGLSASEALELVSFGMQNSAGKMDDYFDTIDEYSQLLAEAGYSAQQFTDIITRGMQAGVRDTDKLADSIKEAQIRVNAEDADKALADINVPIRNTIQGIVDMAQAGEITIQEMLSQVAQTLDTAFEGGEITASVRDQLMVAVAGTPAEDVGGALWTKIMSQPIDEEAVKEKGKQAAELIEGSVGSVTVFEKLSRNMEVIATKASQFFQPVIAGAGSVVTKVGEIAPALYQVQEIDFGKLSAKFQGLQTSADKFLGKSNLLSKSLSKMSGLGGTLGKLGGAVFNPWVLGSAAAIGGITLFLTKTEKGQAIMKRMSSTVQALIKKLQPVFEGLMDIGEEFIDALFAIGEVLWEMLITPLELVWEIIELGIDLFLELIGETDSAGDSMEFFGNVLHNVADAIGFVTKFVRQMVDQIKLSKNFVFELIKGFPELMEIIFDYGKYYLNPANWIDGDESYEEELSKRLGNAVAGAAKRAKEKLKKEKVGDEVTNTIAGDSDDVKKQEDAVKKITAAATKANAQAKTAVELAEEKYKSAEKALGLEERQFKLAQDRRISEEKRSRDAQDELALKAEELDILQRQRQALLDAYKVTENQDGTLNIGVKGADEGEVKDELLKIDESIQDNAEDVEAIRVSLALEQEEIEKLKTDLLKQDIQYQIEIGVISKEQGYERLNAIYTQELEDIRAKMAAVDQTTKEGLEEYSNLRSQEIELERMIRDQNQQLYDDHLNNLANYYDERKSQIESRLEEENKIFIDFIAQRNDIEAREIESDKSGKLTKVDEEEQARLDKIEEYRDMDILSKEQYEQRKLEIEQDAIRKREAAEEEARKRQLVLIARQQASEIEIQRQKFNKILKLEEDRLKEEIALLEAKPGKTEEDSEQLDRLKNELVETEELFKQKGTVLGVLTDQLNTNITEGLNGLFAGDPDALKENAREYFAVVGEILTQQLEAFVLSMLLNEQTITWITGTFGAFAPAVIAVAHGLISSVVRSIADPIIAGITSFASGSGPLTTPQLAIVGDAPVAERVLRDDQLMVLLETTLSRFMGRLYPALMENMTTVLMQDQEAYKATTANLAEAALGVEEAVRELNQANRNITTDTVDELLKSRGFTQLWEGVNTSIFTMHTEQRQINSDLRKAIGSLGEQISKLAKSQSQAQELSITGGVNTNGLPQMIAEAVKKGMQDITLETNVDGRKLYITFKLEEQRIKSRTPGG